MLFLKQFIKNNNIDVEVIYEPNAETIQAMEEVKIGETEELSLSAFRRQLYFE